jgi:hypothetical protein
MNSERNRIYYRGKILSRLTTINSLSRLIRNDHSATEWQRQLAARLVVECDQIHQDVTEWCALEELSAASPAGYRGPGRARPERRLEPLGADGRFGGEHDGPGDNQPASLAAHEAESA